MSGSASTSDNTFRCQITRSERPCLVCSGHMDLIEARPSKLNFFGGIPIVCSSEGVDCLDCPRCGFKTTTTDYEYLKMCKKTRQVRGMFHGPEHRRISKEGSHSQSQSSRSRKRTSRSQRNESFATSHSGSERICSGCQVALESNEWQFCPKCGSKCRAETHVLSSSSMSSGCDVSNDIIEITIPKTISNDPMISDDDNNVEITKNNSSSNNDNTNNISDVNISDANSITETNTSPSKESSGISRMVTPPKRSNVLDCSMEGPVEMQY